jgi:hypothetical protein
MTNLQDLTTSQLKRIIAIKEQIETLQSELTSVLGSEGEVPAPFEKAKRRHMSAAARARIAAGARARWAKVKGTATSASKPGRKRKNRLSAAGRAAIIAGTKARWARLKGSEATPETKTKRDRRSSPAVRAKLAAAARARWAKAKAAGQSSL